MEGMVVAALRGPDAAASSAGATLPDEQERELARALTLIWFALLVGWSGGLHGQDRVIEQMSGCVDLMLLGAQAKQTA
jgi:hypothetical protein